MALPTNYTKEETSTEGKDNSENSSSNGSTAVENDKKSRQTNSARVIYHRGMSTNRLRKKGQVPSEYWLF